MCKPEKIATIATIAQRLVLVAASGLFVGCGRGDSVSKPIPSANQVTYCRDVAPIVFQHCVPCHRDNGAGPFPLETYGDVKSRAQQIADVTASQYMPPWLPRDGDHAFFGDRRLAADQISTIDKWASNGTAEGDVADLPEKPTFDSEWWLGEPDLVVSMPQAFTKAAGPSDTWRNFVLASNLTETKYVRAYDIDPGNAPAVHHAVLEIDGVGRARALDAKDPGLGYDGMQNGRVSTGGGRTPSGLALGWTPGKIPIESNGDTGWQINSGDDLILQLHMPSTGKDEAIQSRVALYFMDQPPRRQPMSIVFSVRDIDIPPGEDQYTREQSFVLPVDVQLLGIYPHAHYLCVEMRSTALLPDGREEVLLNIPQWDFDWQDDYRYVQPVNLPKGTELSLSYRYDNTSANVRNPNQPPKRIRWGEQSTDAMGDLIFYVVPQKSTDRKQLVDAYMEFQYRLSLLRHQRLLAENTHSPKANNAVGEALLLLRRPAEATIYFEKAIELGDKDPRLFVKLAIAHKQQSDIAKYLEYQNKAVAAEPNNIAYRRELAVGLQVAKKWKAAEFQYRELLKRRSTDVVANTNLGMLLGRAGKFAASERYLKQALETDPTHAVAHINLGITLRQQKRFDEAIKHFRQALQLEPENPGAAKMLSDAIRRRGR